MAEIKLKKRYKYVGDIFPKLIDIGFDIETATDFLNSIKDADVVEVVRCKDCLYFEYKTGSYGACEHWHTNSQDIFDLNFCGYAEPRTPKERGGEK